MIKGRDGDWSSYPVYPFELFDEIKATYDLFPVLFEHDASTPMDDFIMEKFAGQNIWQPLRENCKTEDKVRKGLSSQAGWIEDFQFLKWRNTKNQRRMKKTLSVWFQKFYPEEIPSIEI